MSEYININESDEGDTLVMEDSNDRYVSVSAHLKQRFQICILTRFFFVTVHKFPGFFEKKELRILYLKFFFSFSFLIQ